MNYKKIKEIMNFREFTYEDLSILSHIPVSTLSKIGSGLTPNPRFDTMLAISKALNCSMDEFCDRPPLIPYDMEEYAFRFNHLPQNQKEYIKYVITTEFDRELYLQSNEKISLKCFLFSHILNGLAEYESMQVKDIQVDENYLSLASTFCVLLQTDTLQPKFFKNSLLGFQYNDMIYPKQGEIWILKLTDGYLYMGRYYKNKNCLMLKSLNGTIEDLVIDNPANFTRVGRFVGVLKAPE